MLICLSYFAWMDVATAVDTDQQQHNSTKDNSVHEKNFTPSPHLYSANTIGAGKYRISSWGAFTYGILDSLEIIFSLPMLLHMQQPLLGGGVRFQPAFLQNTLPFSGAKFAVDAAVATEPGYVLGSDTGDDGILFSYLGFTYSVPVHRNGSVLSFGSRHALESVRIIDPNMYQENKEYLKNSAEYFHYSTHLISIAYDAPVTQNLEFSTVFLLPVYFTDPSSPHPLTEVGSVLDFNVTAYRGYVSNALENKSEEVHAIERGQFLLSGIYHYVPSSSHAFSFEAGVKVAYFEFTNKVQRTFSFPLPYFSIAWMF